MLLLKARGLAAALVLFASLFVDAAFNDALALKPRGAWSPSVNYALDDIVTLRGSTWRSKHANNKGKLPGSTTPSTAADWELFASGFNPIGEWVSSRTYQRNDLVTRSGAVYRALRTSLNKTPGLPTTTADWQVFVLRGATGPQGPQGVPGSTAVANGSAAAPAFKFTSSPDTGIFSPSTGRIAMVAGGSLFLHDIGSDNLGLGNSALNSATTGVGNVALGLFALNANTTGGGNVAVGRTALLNNTSGSDNTAVGDLAMQGNSTGSRNTALGDHALFSNTSNDNTAVGYQALLVNTASDNSAFGSDALLSNTTGVDNTAVGKRALRANIDGFRNTAVGREALVANTGGFNNTATGYLALSSNIDGERNTAAGAQALEGNSAGNDNIAVGNEALLSNSSGSGNIAIGNFALLANTSGGGNVAIGLDAGRFATNPSQSIFIRNGGNADDTLTIKIGDQSVQTSAFIAGIASANIGSGASVFVNLTTGQLGTVLSSRRYKEDIQPMGAMGDMLSRLRPVSFRYIKSFADGSKPLQYGLIAEEVAEVFPYLAVFNEHGQPETVKYHLLPTFLLAAYQEQQKVIGEQADRISELEARLATIEAMLEQTAVIKASDIR